MARDIYSALGMEPPEFAAVEAEVADEGTTEVSFNTLQVQERAKQDLNFFAPLAMPEVFVFDYPVILLAVWQWLTHFAFLKRDFSKLALGLPRGFAKTTLMKLFVLYCILFTDKKFILILSSTQDHADNFISDIADMLDEPNIKAVFGDWRAGLTTDMKKLKKFGFRGRNIILAGLGEGGTVRGMNLKHARPDVMILEDIQTSEAADSEVQSKAIYKWMLGTLMKAKNPSGCLYIFVANMYASDHSILRKLKNNPSWIKFITGGIQADGTSLWEELQPLEQLLEEYQSDINSGCPEIFHAEVLNDENISKNNLVDLSKVPKYPYDDYEIAIAKWVEIDPSGVKEKSDAVSIGYWEMYEPGKPVLLEVEEGRLTPLETIEIAINMCLVHGAAVVGIEATAYQATLGWWFNWFCTQRGIVGISAVELQTGKTAKVQRILKMFPAFQKGDIIVHPSVRPQVDHQIVNFDPTSTTNVDGLLDLLVYGPKMIQQYSVEITAFDIVDALEQTDYSVSDEDVSCAF